VEQAKAQQTALEDLWQQYMATGDLAKAQQIEASLGGLTPMAGYDPALAQSQAMEKIQARPEYDILRELDVPMLEKNQGRGKEYKFPEEWYKGALARLGSVKLQHVEEIARKRQRELDKAKEAIATPDKLAQLTGVQGEAQEAKAKYQEILNDPRWADVAQFAPMELKTTRKGRRAYQRPNRIDGSGIPVSDAIYNKLVARQGELEKWFGDEAGQGGGKEGKYEQVLPLYFGGAAGDILQRAPQTADTRPYVQFGLGASPSRETVGTKQQKQIFNRISDLLGQADRLAETDPQKAAELSAAVDQYLIDEEGALAQRGVQLDKNRQEWLNTLQRARKKYRKSKSGLRGLASSLSGFMGDIGIGRDLQAPLLTAGGAMLGLPTLPTFLGTKALGF
jgi:hypothetical protein